MWSSLTWLWWQRNWALPIVLPLAPRSITDLSAATGADAQSLSTGSCAATTAGDDGRRLLSLLGWLHLIREDHRLERDVKQPQARLAPHLRSRALTYAVSWSLWTPLVIFGDHMPGTLGFVLTVSDSLVPSTVGILIVARLCGKRGVRTLLGLVPLGVGLSVLFGGQSPVIASTIVGVVVGRLVDLPRERSGRGARMARACPAASAIPPQRPARKPYRRSALGIVASAAVLDRSGAPSAEPLSSVRSQCRRCVSGLHLDVQRHQRKPAHRRALPRHRIAHSLSR
jgi:hypothetical protein